MRASGRAAGDHRAAAVPRRADRRRTDGRGHATPRRGLHRRRDGRLLQPRHRRQLGPRSATSRPAFYDEAQWASLCGRGQAGHSPAGRLRRSRDEPGASAERVLEDGHAELTIGFARAMIAETPELIAKTVAGRESDVRPCIGLQECIDRRTGIENLPVRVPRSVRHAGRGGEEPPAGTIANAAATCSSSAVAPPGTEFAAQMAERGHRVRLWERSGHPRRAAGTSRHRCGMTRAYANWIPWQTARLDTLGVDVQLGREARHRRTSSPLGPDVGRALPPARCRAASTSPAPDLPHVLGAADVITGTVRGGGPRSSSCPRTTASRPSASPTCWRRTVAASPSCIAPPRRRRSWASTRSARCSPASTSRTSSSSP